MEERCSDRIAKRLPFPLSGEEDLHKSEDLGVQSVADSISDMTTRQVNLSSDGLYSSGNGDEGGMSIPLSIRRKLQRDNCHHANQIPVTPIMSTPASNLRRNTILFSADRKFKLQGIV